MTDPILLTDEQVVSQFEIRAVKKVSWHGYC